ncbi:MAG TPA: hypothetical protein VN455_03300 [Methanotrichaceae archaeon]|nr:hypothetical protein [Methanotrichaceae archaeon]
MDELEYTCNSCYRYTVVIPDESLLTEDIKRRIPTDCPNCGIKLTRSAFHQVTFWGD